MIRGAGLVPTLLLGAAFAACQSPATGQAKRSPFKLEFLNKMDYLGIVTRDLVDPAKDYAKTQRSDLIYTIHRPSKDVFEEIRKELKPQDGWRSVHSSNGIYFGGGFSTRQKFGNPPVRGSVLISPGKGKKNGDLEPGPDGKADPAWTTIFITCKDA